jgi:hypothetical protein
MLGGQRSLPCDISLMSEQPPVWNTYHKPPCVARPSQSSTPSPLPPDLCFLQDPQHSLGANVSHLPPSATDQSIRPHGSFTRLRVIYNVPVGIWPYTITYPTTTACLCRVGGGGSDHYHWNETLTPPHIQIVTVKKSHNHCIILIISVSWRCPWAYLRHGLCCKMGVQ